MNGTYPHIFIGALEALLAGSYHCSKNPGLMGPRTKLIKARERRGVSRIDLAERLGMTRQYVMRVEDGLRNPSHETMVRWADALGISMDKFRDAPPQQSRTAA